MCRVRKDFETCPPDDSLDPAFNGYNAILAGDYDSAFYWLNKAADLPFSVVNQTNWIKLFAPQAFLADPRYKDLLERINLTDEWKNELCSRARTLTPSTGVAVTCR